MKFAFLSLILIGCAHQKPLKYKYFSPKREIASVMEKDSEVSSSHIKLKDQKIFASGVDSTYLMVKLFNNKGEQLTNLDTGYLSLLTSEDIEAKPFTIKQGVYKSQLMPRLKSPSMRVQVLWKDLPAGDPLTLSTTTSPLNLTVQASSHENHEALTREEVEYTMRNETHSESFEIENLGSEKIVPQTKVSTNHRAYKFNYTDQAKQNLSFDVEDSINSNVDHVMHSHFMIFPRKKLFTVEQHNGLITVSLPNGEEVVFEQESKEIVGGVLVEGVIDLNPDRFTRRFSNLKYQGQDVILRANARGQVPQIGQYETKQIDQNFGEEGSVDVLIINGKTGQRCVRPKSDFWEPMDVNPIEFKFPTDEAFDFYLKAKCGFGLPRL